MPWRCLQAGFQSRMRRCCWKLPKLNGSSTMPRRVRKPRLYLLNLRPFWSRRLPEPSIIVFRLYVYCLTFSICSGKNSSGVCLTHKFCVYSTNDVSTLASTTHFLYLFSTVYTTNRLLLQRLITKKLSNDGRTACLHYNTSALFLLAVFFTSRYTTYAIRFY